MAELADVLDLGDVTSGKVIKMKKSIWELVLGVAQMGIGALAVLSIVVLAANGEEIAKWIPAFLLGIAWVVMGILGIKAYKSKE